jgi:alkylated DNA repair protein (DNA oxidative demethylase)
MMLDLFGTPVLPGLHTMPDIVDRAEERMLIERIDATDLDRQAPDDVIWLGV